MADFEAYALGEKKDYDASMEQVEMLTQKYEVLMHQLSEAEDRTGAWNRAKVHESFAVKKLTPELMDENVKDIEVYSEDDIRIIWK